MGSAIDVLDAIILGAVQGATEFLPVSSSGHVSLTAMALGVSAEMPLSMVVLLHFGTLVATLGVFRADVRALLLGAIDGLRTPRAWLETQVGKETCGILIASVPTAALGLTLEAHVEEASRIGGVVGLGLLGSAIVVASTRRGGGDLDVLPLGRAFIVGVAQGLAVLPGLSRSGTTIAVAMLLGMSGPAAFRFSFLLSLPAVAGATLLSARHYRELAELGASGVAGGLVAGAVGLGALLWLRDIVQRGRFWTFALYLLPLGLGLVGWHLWNRGLSV